MIPVHQNDTFFHSTDCHNLIYFRVLSNRDTIYSDGQTFNSRPQQEEKDRCTHHIKTEI